MTVVVENPEFLSGHPSLNFDTFGDIASYEGTLLRVERSDGTPLRITAYASRTVASPFVVLERIK